jgi:hypothetical protein
MTAIAIAVGLLLSTGDVCELATVERTRDNFLGCLACHDGVTAPSGIGLATAMVGKEYAPARLRRRGELKPLSRGSPVVLCNGRVTCTSCHDGASALPKKVAAVDVCTVCHDR